MMQKPLKIFLLLLFVVSTYGAGAHAEAVVAKRNIFSASTGAYQFTKGSASFALIGMLQLSFRRMINPKWSVEASFENGLSTSALVSARYWGLDFGASYSLLSPVPIVQQVSDVVKIEDTGKFGMFMTLGMMTRSVPLAVVTLSFSGPYMAVVPVYRITDEWLIQGRLQWGLLFNGPNYLQAMTLSGGIGFQF